MKKQHITYLVVLMGLALIGLSALQFYWLGLALQANRDRFRQEANDMMANIARKLEQQEAVSVVQQQVGNGITILADSVMMNIDSMGTVRWREEQRIVNRQIVGTSALSADGFAYEVEEETFITKSGIARRNRLADLPKEHLRITQSPLKFTNVTRDDSLAYQYQLMRKSDIVTSIVNELMNASKGKAIQDRVKPELLDSLIQQELVSRGIQIACLYGIKDHSKPGETLMLSNAPESSADIMQMGFSHRLFPTEAFGNRNVLYLYFPQTERYIYQKMWWGLLITAFLLSVVIGCFALAIRTIFRQKKLSDITNDFISNMTHELKTPIATVSLAAEALLDPDIRNIPRQTERYLGIIQEENRRLAQQVEKVLQIAQLEKGDFQLDIKQVDLHEIIKGAVHHMAVQLEAREGRIETHLMASNHVLMADKLHLSNIISNLLDNANKYSPETPRISVRTANATGGISIEISDKGKGISKDMLDKVFDKFFRVPTGDLHDVKGFGLGLSYVKTMVEAHKGHISAKSELGQGSTFNIFLPYEHEA